MRSITLAVRYIWRKRGRTISLLLILLVVATTTLTGLAVRGAAADAQQAIRQALGGVFTIEQDESNPENWTNRQIEGMGYQQVFAGKPITAELCGRVMAQVQGIRGCDATTEQVLVPETTDGRTLELIDDGSGTDPASEQAFSTDDFGDTVTVIGGTDSRFDANFAKGYLVLADGEPVIDPAARAGSQRSGTDDDTDDGTGAGTSDDGVVGDVLIGSQLAEHNGLRIGDTIVLRRATVHAQMSGTTVERTRTPVRIVGLFDQTAKSSALTSNWSMTNAMFTTMDVVDHSREGTAEEGFDKVSFYVTDPEHTADIAARVQALDELSGGQYVVSQDTADADAVSEPLRNLDALVLALVVLALAAGMVILCLVLASRVKERMHESGVLLSLGFSRWAILAQYLIEAVLVAVVAFALSVPIGSLIGQFVGDRLLGMSRAGTGGTSGGTSGGLTSKAGMTVANSDMMSPSFTPNADMGSIHVVIDGWTIAGLYGLGLALVAVSVGLSGVVLMRRRPKDILAAMS